ncbi:hypothetical protein D3C86_1996160 [compost metagenome]
MDGGASMWHIILHVDDFTGAGEDLAATEKSVISGVCTAVWFDQGLSSHRKNSVPVAEPLPKFS